MAARYPGEDLDPSDECVCTCHCGSDAEDNWEAYESA